MKGRARQEETPPPARLAQLAQLLQIPHLTDARASLAEEPLLQAPALFQWRRPGFEGDCIAGCSVMCILVTHEMTQGRSENWGFHIPTAAKWWSYNQRTAVSLFATPMATELSRVPALRSSVEAVLLMVSQPFEP